MLRWLSAAIYGCWLIYALCLALDTKGAVFFFRAALLLWLVSLVFNRGRLRRQPLLAPIAVFLAFTALSCVFSLEPALSWARMRGVSLVLVPVLLTQTIRSARRLRWLAVAAAASFIIAGSFTAYRFIAGSGVSAHPQRAQGFFYSYIPYSEALAFAVVLFWALWLYGRRAGDWGRTVIGLALLLSAVALVLTATRAPMLSAFVAAFAIYWMHAGWKRALAALALSGVLLAAGSFWLQERRGFGWYSDDAGTEYRYLMWKDGMRIAREHPLTGVGMDSVYEHWQQLHIEAYQRYPNLKSHFHSTYIQLAAECGVPALVAWLWLLGAALVYCGRKLRAVDREREGSASGLLAAAMGAVIAMLGICVFHYTLGDSEAMVVFWMVLGMALAAGALPAGPQLVAVPSAGPGSLTREEPKVS